MVGGLRACTLRYVFRPILMQMSVSAQFNLMEHKVYLTGNELTYLAMVITWQSQALPCTNIHSLSMGSYPENQTQELLPCFGFGRIMHKNHRLKSENCTIRTLFKDSTMD